MPKLCPLLIPVSHPAGTLEVMRKTDARDQGLRRISGLTAWVAALGVAATGVFAAVVARATPGRSSPAGVVTVQGGSSPATLAPSVDPGFQAPLQAPIPVQQAPIVRSGQS